MFHKLAFSLNRCTLHHQSELSVQIILSALAQSLLHACAGKVFFYFEWKEHESLMLLVLCYYVIMY